MVFQKCVYCCEKFMWPNAEPLAASSTSLSINHCLGRSNLAWHTVFYIQALLANISLCESFSVYIWWWGTVARQQQTRAGWLSLKKGFTQNLSFCIYCWGFKYSWFRIYVHTFNISFWNSSSFSLLSCLFWKTSVWVHEASARSAYDFFLF